MNEQPHRNIKHVINIDRVKILKCQKREEEILVPLIITPTLNGTEHSRTEGVFQYTINRAP